MMLWYSSGKVNYSLYAEDGSAKNREIRYTGGMGRSGMSLVVVPNLDKQLTQKSIRFYAIELCGVYEENWKEGQFGEVLAGSPTTPYSLLLTKLKEDQCLLIRTPNHALLYMPSGVTEETKEAVKDQGEKVLRLIKYTVLGTPEEVARVTATEPPVEEGACILA